jgi:hypothetical protein
MAGVGGANVAAHPRGLLDGDPDARAAAVERYRSGVRPLAEPLPRSPVYRRTGLSPYVGVRGEQKGSVRPRGA